METLLYILAFVAVLAGLAGSFLPVLPGPPLAWLALLLLYFLPDTFVTGRMLTVHGLVVVAVTALDYYIPIWGTRQFGGTPAGVRGSTIGLIIGLFFAPLGILIGPFAGAFLGELLGGSDQRQAMRAAVGSFLGFVAGTLLKLAYALYVLYLMLSSLW